uniref:ABC-2 type transporter n=1 Tax=Rhodaphanes brevistipitata TaxID=446136 RepID=UPI001FCDD233|nr:ABC-2 type transporter [Rhodaphanes brevistipitata]UNJ18490.1 ABC-2 type transporter [Rhodaphanes brevistipitata]
MTSTLILTLQDLTQETYALTKRLVIQTKRRPSTLLAGIIQPVLWLTLFGALFQNAPIDLFSVSKSYRHFLTPGIMVFTVFTGALNAGLPLMFDREFGFLNRLVVAPLVSQLSIVFASAIYISALSFIQTLSIMIPTICVENNLGLKGILITTVILILLTCSLTMFSIGLSFILPGHIELLAIIFLVNLPLLFASTALVPLSFMPMWLQVIASFNPLSYAIETIRSLYFLQDWSLNTSVIKTFWGDFSIWKVILMLVGFNILVGIFVGYCVQAKIK